MARQGDSRVDSRRRGGAGRTAMMLVLLGSASAFVGAFLVGPRLQPGEPGKASEQRSAGRSSSREAAEDDDRSASSQLAARPAEDPGRDAPTTNSQRSARGSGHTQ